MSTNVYTRTVIGPNVVLDNNTLQLYLDAANSKSYPGNGTTWSDLSKNRYNGTLINGTTFNSGNAGYFIFDGVDDYVSLGNRPNLAPSTGDFSALFWIYPTNWDNTYMPVFVTATVGGMWIGKNDTNFVLRSYAIDDDLQYATLPTVSAWTQVVITRISNNTTMYYNGKSVTSGTVTRDYVSDNSYIGTDGSGNVIASKLSTYMFYNKGLTSQEVLQNYNAIKSRYGL